MSVSQFDHTADTYRILLNGEWDLDDLYEFPHAFNQCYSFVYCLDTELDVRHRERIDRAFAEYPWRGGFSYLNIYAVLQRQVPWQARPIIRSIQKASPGWLDLYLLSDVAVQIAKSVSALAVTSVVVAKSYAKVRKFLSELSLERERQRTTKLQLSSEQLNTTLAMCEELAKHLGFESLSDLHRRTGDPEVSLKLLSAHYRRTKVLLEYVEDGKADLPHHRLTKDFNE